MNKTKLIVPYGIQFISEWKDYIFPKGHVIVDKGVTGCGYTEYCLTNNLPIVLCSPRKLLLENKSEQHQGDPNILYVRNDLGEYKDLLDLKTKIKSFIKFCFEELNEPPKLLVTYDSSHYVRDILMEMNLLEEFYFVIDEFQSIFLDSFFKSDIEFDFVENLKVCPNVLYLSATPMLDKYLKKVDEFMNLPFFQIDWSETGYVENIVLQRKQTKSLFGECKKIIEDYKKSKFPMTLTKDNKLVISNEAVFYFNSISEIIKLIHKLELTSDEVNIICADTKENQAKLNKLSRDLKYNSKKGEGFKIGRIPLKGESNKKFTFCTKSAYIGSDFHSTCASSYVFADPNIDSLALDISLDLPQIVGRQRNKDNPFKNNIIIFYKTLRKSEIMTKEGFDKKQKERKNSTKNLLDIFNNLSLNQRNDYIKKLKSDIKLSQYSDDFVSISKSTGLPVYNSFIEIANERAWEVSQKDYQDKISVTKALNEVTSNISEYQSGLEKEIDDFLDNHFYRTGIFESKMRMYCEFMDKHQGSQEVSDSLYFRIKDNRYRKYYNFYGTSGCRAKLYREDRLYSGMMNVSKESELSSIIYSKFKEGDRLIAGDIKKELQNIYRDLGITDKAKATDLSKYFKLSRTRITFPDKTVREGFKLESLL